MDLNNQIAKEDQILKIPKDHFVYGVNLDADPPYFEIKEDCPTGLNPVQRVEFPKALAYFLTVHFCGSNIVKNRHIQTGRSEIIKEIKNILHLL